MRRITLSRRMRGPRHVDTSDLRGTAPAAGGDSPGKGEKGGGTKSRLEVIALVAAGLVGLYQWTAGYHSTDTALELDAQRVHAAAGDLVVVDALLSRTRRKTELTDLQCRVYCASGRAVPCSFPGLARRPVVDGGEAGGVAVHHHYIAGWEPVRSGEAITSMAPGDKAQFAGIARGLPRDQVCALEVAVVMKKKGSLAWLFGGADTNVRRSTLVSLPVDSIR
jgi:hypothetical protein